MRRVLLATGLLTVACLIAACGLRLPTVVRTQYPRQVEWTQAPEALSSLDTTAAALALIPRFTRTGTVARIDSSESAVDATMPPATSLRLDSIVEEFKPSPDARHLEATGQYDVAVASSDGTLGTFAMKKGASSWMYSDDGYPETWWGWDRYPLRPFLKPGSQVRLVWGAGQLVWYVVTTNGNEFAFPAVHMGPVSIAPQGSSDWVKVETKPYPVDAVFQRIRWD